MRRLLLLAVLVPAPALAASVYLNGVLIDGVADQEFTVVKKVTIDGSGNVHIEAPDYTIERHEVGAKPETKTEKKYVLVSESVDQGLEVHVFVNGEPVRTIKPGEGPVIEDITSRLHPGDNEVRIEAAGKGELGVAVGEAHVAGEQTVVDDPQVAMRVTPGAARKFTLRAR